MATALRATPYAHSPSQPETLRSNNLQKSSDLTPRFPMDVTYANSRAMQMAWSISTIIAHVQNYPELQLRQVIAGIYVANFDRLLRFWPHAAVFEDFIAEKCDWKEHRIVTWDRWTSETRRPPRTIPLPFRNSYLSFRRKGAFIGRSFAHSEELKRVELKASEISINKVNRFGEKAPLITPELFLLATIQTSGVELGQMLVQAGVLVEHLEQESLRAESNPERFVL